MRILLIHPNYHSGGAEIAGNWPPAWAAYLAGALKTAGFTDIRFIDAMTNTSRDDALRAILAEEKPDVIGATAITPSIYKAERVLQIAKELHPNVGDDARRHPRDLHVPAGAERGALDRCDRARRGRGDPDRPGAGDRRGPLACRSRQDQGHCVYANAGGREGRGSSRPQAAADGQKSRRDQARTGAFWSGRNTTTFR